EVHATAVELVDTDIGPILCTFSERMPCGSRVVVSVRPENIKLARERPPDDANSINGRIKERSYYMGLVEYTIDVRGYELKVRSSADGAEINGDSAVCLKLAPEKCVAIGQQEEVS
ncbi:MAG TPA: TOBE domain-containing protein, partial [Candidatus Binatia bacterium]|nr:TOBE domain-containing protein [Candidatus Binatia bacterium]